MITSGLLCPPADVMQHTGAAAMIPQGKLVVRHEKVKLPNVVDDVLELCQPLVSCCHRL
jgi:hypothetical protein